MEKTSLINIFARHPTAANLLMLLFLALGAITVGEIRRETFPDFASTEVEVTAGYPGATAEEVESAVCERIEEAVEGVTHLVKVTSTASEGRSVVIMEMEDGADAAEFLNDIKTEVEAISNFPEEVEDVIVRRLNRTDQVLSIAVTGPMNESHLKLYCEELKKKITRLPLVSQVDLLGFSEHQLLVEVPYYNLMRLGISVAEIKELIQRQSVDLPSGSIESIDREYLIRFTEERRTVQELSELVVVSSEAGYEIKLGDIARISDRFEDRENGIFFNGKRAGMLQINKNKSEDALDIMDQVQAFIEEERKRAPPGVQFFLTQNVSKIVRDRLNMLSVNGLEGLLLVFITLWLFFNVRMSFWVAMGLPVSFFLTFFFMKQIGFSFNMLSMVGLLIAVGILMDDAIVLAENVAAHLERGIDTVEAVVKGVRGVAPGVWSSYLTTLFIFGALALSMEGDIGKVLYAIPVMLILTLSVSMVEAFCILPNHLAHSFGNGPGKPSRFRIWFEHRIDRLREKVVGGIVVRLVEFRYLFLGCVIFLFFLSISLLAGGLVKFKAFPDIEGDVLQARILLPQGAPLERTRKVVARLISEAERLNEELMPLQPEGKALVVNHAVNYNLNADAQEKGPHVATVTLDLLSAEERNTTMDYFIHRWREGVGDITDIISIAYKEPSIGPGGLAIEIQLKGEDLSQLKRASFELLSWLKGYQGVQDLDDDLRPGKPELRLLLNRGAMVMGFSSQDIARQLRAAYHGSVVGEVIRDGEPYEIMVRLDGSDMARISQLKDFHVISPQGVKVPLKSLASIEQGRGYARINRINGERTVTITGEVDTAVANAQEIVNDTREKFIPQLLKKFPELTLSFEGQAAESRTSMGGMVRAFLIGIFGVFILLSIQFRNYFEPLVVMVLIPFAFIGVIWGHFLMGLDLTMPSIMGFISLAGIVVNDSILLVTFVHKHLQAGLGVQVAAVRASKERFRAVLLTSMTTIMGLLPLMSERSLQAQILIPLATSIVFGLLATTMLVLFVIPSVYSVLDDLRLISLPSEGKNEHVL